MNESGLKHSIIHKLVNLLKKNNVEEIFNFLTNNNQFQSSGNCNIFAAKLCQSDKCKLVPGTTVLMLIFIVSHEHAFQIIIQVNT